MTESQAYLLDKIISVTLFATKHPSQSLLLRDVKDNPNVELEVACSSCVWAEKNYTGHVQTSPEEIMKLFMFVSHLPAKLF